MGFRRGKRLKQVWQLHAVTHDGISHFVTQVFADKQTIFGVEEYPQRVSGAQESVRQRLQNAQREEREEGERLAWDFVATPRVRLAGTYCCT